MHAPDLISDVILDAKVIEVEVGAAWRPETYHLRLAGGHSFSKFFCQEVEAEIGFIRGCAVLHEPKLPTA